MWWDVEREARFRVMAAVEDYLPVVRCFGLLLFDVSDKVAAYYSWQTNVLAVQGVVGFDFAGTVEQIGEFIIWID